jgi:alkylation response protein AidB-like acyl-CoA dehydrogenase
MNFNLNSEQQMLQDSVRRFIDKDYAFDARNAQLKKGAEGAFANWQTFADNGWIAAALPESLGGLGGSALDTALIAHELGRGLVAEPFVGCGVLAVQTLLASTSPAQLDRIVPSVADGSLKLALAFSEAQARGCPESIQLRAQRRDNGYALYGKKTLVLGGTHADWLIVSARVDDVPGATLFLVAADSAGLTRRALPLHDGSWVAEVTFDGVTVGGDVLLGEPGEGLAALRHGLSHATAALCAELVGGMEKAIDITADYLKVRKQFGVPIGSFQALQHRLADMAAELEVARSMLYALLASLANDGADDQWLAVSQAKMIVGRAAKFVCGQAIQLHGGIGMTEEYSVGHYYKRAVVADILFGSSDRHEAACAARLQQALSAGGTQS